MNFITNESDTGLEKNFDDEGVTVFFLVLAFLVGIRFIQNILDILLLIFTSILITLAVCPIVDKLQKKGINRRLSSITILLSFFAVLVAIGASLASPLSEQINLFVERLPVLIRNLAPLNLDLGQITSQFSFLPNQIVKIALDTFSAFITAFAVIMISFYMIQEMPSLRSYLEYWYGKEKGERLFQIASKLETEIGNWVRGELFLMLFVGVLSYIGYLIIGLPYSLAIAVVAGVLEIIPNIGPTITVIPAVLVGLSLSPAHGLAALIVSILVQQIENNFLVPVVMKRAANLHPIVTIIVLMIGYRLGGPLLAIVVLPLALSLRVVLAHIKVNKNTNIPEID